MRAFANDCRISWLLLIVLIGAIAVPACSFADDDNTDKKASNPPAKPAAAKVESPAPLTEREQYLLDQLEELKKRVAELESKAGSSVVPAAAAPAPQPASSNPASPSTFPSNIGPTSAPAVQAAVSQTPSVSPATTPAAKAKIEPFSDWDWTWLNGNPRNKDVAFDSKFFTPEIRADITYNYDFNKPTDNSMGGSSELFRSNEIQLEQLGLGGDFHYDNVRARFMTQFGMYSTATIRNDPATPRGNGISPMRIATWRKHMAAITLTR